MDIVVSRFYEETRVWGAVGAASGGGNSGVPIRVARGGIVDFGIIASLGLGPVTETICEELPGYLQLTPMDC